jgi:hypothetical protein
MNRKLIVDHLAEAQGQLRDINIYLKGKRISSGRLQVMFEHLYHHINMAWNTRGLNTSRYRKMNDQDFNAWSKFPKRIWEFKLKHE